MTKTTAKLHFYILQSYIYVHIHTQKNYNWFGINNFFRQITEWFQPNNTVLNDERNVKDNANTSKVNGNVNGNANYDTFNDINEDTIEDGKKALINVHRNNYSLRWRDQIPNKFH